MGYKGYKDGLQPESLADGNWLVKQNQPVSKIETKSDTNTVKKPRVINAFLSFRNAFLNSRALHANNG
jgi:hypothetical protein